MGAKTQLHPTSSRRAGSLESITSSSSPFGSKSSPITRFGTSSATLPRMGTWSTSDPQWRRGRHHGPHRWTDGRDTSLVGQLKTPRGQSLHGQGAQPDHSDPFVRLPADSSRLWSRRPVVPGSSARLLDYWRTAWRHGMASQVWFQV